MAQISDATIWRWLSDDAIAPWRHLSWIFPRDPDSEAKADRVLDLYAGRFEGRRLRHGEYVVSADEKTSIQAHCRCRPSLPPAPGGPCGSSTSTSAAGPSSTWLPGTSTGPSFDPIDDAVTALIDDAVTALIDDSVEFGRDGPLPEPADALLDVFT